jgi:SAM-dependent methyltransferase
VLRQRLSGRIDFLDAGGRDGGTLRLLKDLSLTGTYTLMDLEPKMASQSDPDFEVEAIRSSFQDFKPPRKFDAILFQSCLEYLDSNHDIAWVADCLKPGGFILATIACKNTRNLYWGVWAQGGRHLLDEEDLAPAFAEMGLRITAVYPLGGAASRTYQTLVHTHASDFIRRVHRATLGRVVPGLKSADPVAPCYRVLNALSARVDRVLPFWRTGHCVVAERAD